MCEGYEQSLTGFLKTFLEFPGKHKQMSHFSKAADLEPQTTRYLTVRAARVSLRLQGNFLSSCCTEDLLTF